MDPSCYGITWPYSDDSWLKEKKGVAVCASKDLEERKEKDWNVITMKCKECPMRNMKPKHGEADVIKTVKITPRPRDCFSLCLEEVACIGWLLQPMVRNR